MNLNQLAIENRRHMGGCRMFVVNTLAPLLRKPLYAKGIDDGVDHTGSYIDKLKSRKNLRCLTQ